MTDDLTNEDKSRIKAFIAAYNKLCAEHRFNFAACSCCGGLNLDGEKGICLGEAEWKEIAADAS